MGLAVAVEAARDLVRLIDAIGDAVMVDRGERSRPRPLGREGCVEIAPVHPVAVHVQPVLRPKGDPMGLTDRNGLRASTAGFCNAELWFLISTTV